MSERTPSLRVLRAATVAAGVVVAHGVDYVVTSPDPMARRHRLAATGHGYWDLALGVAAVAAAAAVALAAATGASAGDGPRVRRPLRAELWRLAAIQMAVFVAVEAVERVSVGISPTVLLASPELIVGLVAQVAVAIVALTVLRSVATVSASVARALGRRRVATARSPRPVPAPTRCCTASPASPARPRGPPRRSFA